MGWTSLEGLEEMVIGRVDWKGWTLDQDNRLEGTVIGRVDWMGWNQTVIGRVGTKRRLEGLDVNWKGRTPICRQVEGLEGTSDSDVVAGRGIVSGRCSYLRCCC